MFTDIIGKIRHKVRQRLVLLYIFDRLERIGIEITPYYITEEFHFDEPDLILKPKLEPLSASFLSSAEIEKMFVHLEAKDVGGGKKESVDEGCLCFVLEHNNQIAAVMWCNLRRCHSKLSPFLLKEDEAYLFGAYTFKAYRGKDLAPYIRYQLYEQLNQMGRTKFYSITKFFNTSALKFKKKLKAKPLKLGLFIRLFNKYQWNVILKEYPR